MPHLLLASASETIDWQVIFLQQCLNGLSFGALIALIALGYTMVYGIIGLINFAHGDLFMLGAFLAWTIVGWLNLDQAGTLATTGGIALLLIVVPVFCAARIRNRRVVRVHEHRRILGRGIGPRLSKPRVD